MGYACADLGWSENSYLAALRELVTANLIRWDERTSEIMIERWFAHNGPMNTKHRTGIERIVQAIKSDELRAASQDALTAAWSKFIAPKTDQRSYPLPIPGAKNNVR